MRNFSKWARWAKISSGYPFLEPLQVQQVLNVLCGGRPLTVPSCPMSNLSMVSCRSKGACDLQAGIRASEGEGPSQTLTERFKVTLPLFPPVSLKAFCPGARRFNRRDPLLSDALPCAPAASVQRNTSGGIECDEFHGCEDSHFRVGCTPRLRSAPSAPLNTARCSPTRRPGQGREWKPRPDEMGRRGCADPLFAPSLLHHQLVKLRGRTQRGEFLVLH
jgi:hypothetical protein